jgi:hypothetical protein
MAERGGLYCSFFRNSLVFCHFIPKTRIFCRLTQLSQLRAIFGIFAIIFVVKLFVSITEF